MKKIFATTALIGMIASSSAMAGEWNGAYAGLFANHLTGEGPITGVSVQLGYNFDQGNLVYGGELDISNFAEGTLKEIHGRIGIKITPDLLAYGLVGAGRSMTGTNAYAVFGAGAEYRFAPGWSLRADYEHLQVFGGDGAANSTRLGIVRNF